MKICSHEVSLVLVSCSIGYDKINNSHPHCKHLPVAIINAEEVSAYQIVRKLFVCRRGHQH